MLKSKKAQLGIIEFKFLVIGLIIGLIAAVVLIYLANKGILPFKLSFVCPVSPKWFWQAGIFAMFMRHQTKSLKNFIFICVRMQIFRLVLSL